MSIKPLWWDGGNVDTVESMTVAEAIRIARKNLADTHDLRLVGNRMYGRGAAGSEAGRAYNKLAEIHGDFMPNSTKD